MEVKEIKITFNGMEPTEALKTYVVDKITKEERLLKKATHLNVVLKDDNAHRGVEQDFKLDINVGLPGKNLHVEETGDDMYAVVDSGSDILVRRFRKYEETL